jgi:hypothetical protein
MVRNVPHAPSDDHHPADASRHADTRLLLLLQSGVKRIGAASSVCLLFSEALILPPAGDVDSSHQHWVLDQTVTLVPPHAIIRTGLQLRECGMGGSRHFRQTTAQHLRTLALLQAIGPGSDGSEDSDGSRGTTEDCSDDSECDAEDEYEGEREAAHGGPDRTNNGVFGLDHEIKCSDTKRSPLS